jgi:hypothetical protein
VQHLPQSGPGADDGVRDVLSTQTRQERAPVGLGGLAQTGQLAPAPFVMQGDRDGFAQGGDDRLVLGEKAGGRLAAEEPDAQRLVVQAQARSQGVARPVARDQTGKLVGDPISRAARDP